MPGLVAVAAALVARRVVRNIKEGEGDSKRSPQSIVKEVIQSGQSIMSADAEWARNAERRRCCSAGMLISVMFTRGVWSWFQLPEVKVREAGKTLPSVVSLEERPIVTSPPGWVVSRTVKVVRRPGTLSTETVPPIAAVSSFLVGFTAAVLGASAALRRRQAT